MKPTNKKYCMVVYAEDDRYGTAGHGLDFFANNPTDGILQDIIFGDNLKELMQSTDGNDNEGLFYILYALFVNADGQETGVRFDSGTVDWVAIDEMIRDYEERNSKRQQLEEVLKMQLTDEQVKALSVGWMAFYDEPEAYRNGIVVDCVKRFLEEE